MEKAAILETPSGAFARISRAKVCRIAVPPGHCVLHWRTAHLGILAEISSQTHVSQTFLIISSISSALLIDGFLSHSLWHIMRIAYIDMFTVGIFSLHFD